MLSGSTTGSTVTEIARLADGALHEESATLTSG